MNGKTKAVCAASLASLMLLAIAGCGGGGGDKKADSGKKLTMYWGALEDFMVADINAFQKETGIKVEGVRMSSGETIGRIKAEKANPKASCGSAARLTARFRPRRTASWKNTFPRTLPRFLTSSRIKTVTGPASTSATWASLPMPSS